MINKTRISYFFFSAIHVENSQEKQTYGTRSGDSDRRGFRRKIVASTQQQNPVHHADYGSVGRLKGLSS